MSQNQEDQYKGQGWLSGAAGGAVKWGTLTAIPAGIAVGGAAAFTDGGKELIKASSEVLSTAMEKAGGLSKGKGIAIAAGALVTLGALTGAVLGMNRSSRANAQHEKLLNRVNGLEARNQGLEAEALTWQQKAQASHGTSQGRGAHA